jgi:predicted PurR-regulated permease PerM
MAVSSVMWILNKVRNMPRGLIMIFIIFLMVFFSLLFVSLMASISTAEEINLTLDNIHSTDKWEDYYGDIQYYENDNLVSTKKYNVTEVFVNSSDIIICLPFSNSSISSQFSYLKCGDINILNNITGTGDDSGTNAFMMYNIRHL